MKEWWVRIYDARKDEYFQVAVTEDQAKNASYHGARVSQTPFAHTKRRTRDISSGRWVVVRGTSGYEPDLSD